jgi:hypothetical protein
VNVSRQALEALVAAVVAAILGVLLTPVWNDFWAEMKPKIGAPLVALIGVTVLVGIAVFGLSTLHYFGVLGAGADPVGSRERSDYDALRKRIAAGNWIAREYARRLTDFLDAVDRFFGDVGIADRTLFPHAFGLTKPAPLWTAPAFDRCLGLAFVYPIAAILLIWAVSNHVGPAEAALGLIGTDGWRRAAIVAAVGLLGFAVRWFIRAEGWWNIVMIVIATTAAIALDEAAIGGGVRSVALVLVVFIVIVFGINIILDRRIVTASSVIAFAVASAFALARISTSAAAGVGAMTLFVSIVVTISVAGAFGIVVNIAHNVSVNRGWHGVFLSLFLPFMFLVCLAGAAFLAHLPTWNDFGPLLLFLGLLTLVNAPFDWLSLGLTRALMRRGLERERWWPYFYAIVDALLASVIIGFLAVAMVVTVQSFDDLAARGGGPRLFPPMREFLNAIKAEPGRPEYWWVYAMLFSTMLPSLINLFMAGGGASPVACRASRRGCLARLQTVRRFPPTIACSSLSC